MPRFMDTTTGEFRWVADPSTVTYAILSHTWRLEKDGGEQTYDEVRKIWKRMRKSRASGVPGDVGVECILSHPDISDKIKGICKIAREAGYKLVWIDSACIDKSSSAELAEAINSMFDLYRLSDVCYVYLADVPDTKGDPDRDGSPFRRSRWHERGWTLQELLAPKDVVFLTASWAFLGTKISLAAALYWETHIDGDILLGRASLDSVSVAQRMSWAAYRETTRVEDEAYCLLGIFGVHLSPIYGEGRNAFLRLQEEIMKTIPDQSIFAWGARCLLTSVDYAHNKSVTPAHDVPTGLLASSPKEFGSAKGLRPVSRQEYLALLAGRGRYPTRGLAVVESRDAPSLHSIITPEGVRIETYTIDISQIPQFAAAAVSVLPGSDRLSAEDFEHCLALGRAHSLAVLQCTNEYDELYTLALYRRASCSGVDEQRGFSIATHVRCKPTCRGHALYRVVCLEGCASELALQHLSPKPVQLSLLHHSSAPVPELDSSRNARNTSINLWPSARTSYSRTDLLPLLDLAPLCEDRLRVSDLSIRPLRCERSASGLEIVAKTSIFRLSTPREGSPVAHIGITLVFSHIECQTKRDGWSGRWEPPQDTALRVSIARFVHVPPADGASLDEGVVPCDVCHRRGCEIKECPSKDVGETSRTFTTTSTVKLPERRVAQAEFSLPLSMESGLDDTYQFRRVLRVAVECPVQYASVQEVWSIPRLWLAIEVSGALHRSTSW